MAPDINCWPPSHTQIPLPPNDPAKQGREMCSYTKAQPVLLKPMTMTMMTKMVTVIAVIIYELLTTYQRSRIYFS